MREQFDKKLVEKIKDSFFQNEEPFDPNEWEKFSKSYFGAKQEGYLSNWRVWIVGIAAALLLVFFLIPEKGIEENGMLSKVDTLSADSINVGEEVIDNNINEKPDELRNIVSIENESKSKEKTQEAIGGNAAIKTLSGRPIAAKSPINLAKLPDFEEKTAVLGKNESEKELAISKEEIAIPEFNATPLVSKLQDLEVIQESEKAQEIIKDWLAEAKPELEEEKNDENFTKILRLGVMLAPQSISNTTQSLNLGGGLMTELSFSKKFKLDVGLAYAKQNMTPTGERNRGGFLAMDAQDRKATLSNNLLNASYELSFGQLEIPINLKYRVLEKNASAFYLITGLSNMIYLNQKNVGTFSAANFSTAGFMAAQPMVQTFTETSQPEGNGGSTDSGTLLNLSLGYEYNLTNGTFLSLEPFYKMSIGNQTFANQQFSIGGINLRMNFQLKK